MARHQFVFLLCCAAGMALTAPAQGQSAPPSGNAPTSTAPSNSPAQDSAASQNTATAHQANAGQPAADKPKKVWSNEDVSGLRDDPAVSRVASPSGAKPSKPLLEKTGAPAGARVKLYRDQITRLNARVAKLDSQIAQLQAAADGKAPGDGKISTRPYGARINDWGVELEQAKKDREDLLAKVDALRDEARHSGIPANLLP